MLVCYTSGMRCQEDQHEAQAQHGIQLPQRAGPRPKTTPCAPHSQVDQIVPHARELAALLVSRLRTLSGVQLGESRRAPPGTIGLYLEPACCGGDETAFLLGREFAHVHVQDDCSLHAILPEPLRETAIAEGWAEPHPLAGQPTVSPYTVMLYAPRDEQEVEVLRSLVLASWTNARGQLPAG